jgi:ABC-type glycerol-3-phosphate transport system substrate-binding protein
VAANVGSGPDIIISTMEDAHQYPDKLVDVSDLANYLGTKYGGWYEAAKAYGQHDKKWVAIMMGAAGATLVGRQSQVKAAGFDAFPRDFPGFLKLCQALKAKGTPSGFALGNATGDSNWTFWLLWGHGGKMVDAKNNVVIDSPETIAALEYAKQLYETFIPGTLSWLDPNNNKAFLDNQISLTNNGISIYYAAKTSQDPKLAGNGQRHPALSLPARGRRQVEGVEPGLSDDDLQVLEVPERGQGIPALHDGEGAVRAVAGSVDRVRVPPARGVRVEPVLDGGSRRRRLTATA